MGGSWDLAFQDILSAFEHFLSESGDRPILLAGHSQGRPEERLVAGDVYRFAMLCMFLRILKSEKLIR